jgi:5'-deoxynucleotidase YfbR-like HD superfamily hydrolase
MNIQDKLRASSVKRWHIVATSRTQSLAEHQWNVAMIVKELVRRHRPESVALRNQLVLDALEHDLEEVITGDTPTPEKIRRGGIKENHHLYVKIADVMEALMFIDEYGVGRHAKQARMYQADKLIAILDRINDDALTNAVHSIIINVQEGEFRV